MRFLIGEDVLLTSAASHYGLQAYRWNFALSVSFVSGIIFKLGECGGPT